MKTFVYGMLLGAACAYLWVTNGELMQDTFGSLMSWRTSAQSSVYGYGGKKH